MNLLTQKHKENLDREISMRRRELEQAGESDEGFCHGNWCLRVKLVESIKYKYHESEVKEDELL